MMYHQDPILDVMVLDERDDHGDVTKAQNDLTYIIPINCDGPDPFFASFFSRL